MELLSKLRRLETLLKPTLPLQLQSQSHVRVSEMPRVQVDVYTVLAALLETKWSHPSLAMPMKDGLLLQWDFGAQGYLTLVCESKTPADDFVRIQTGLIDELTP
jgi:hypothetical protein